MKQSTLATRAIAFLLAAIVFLASCSSTTVIRSEPPGATLYLNGERVGTTPYTHTDTKVVGSQNIVELQLEGHETLITTFSRTEEADAGAIIGGFFLFFPFLWTMKYKPVRTYELAPLTEEQMEWREAQMRAPATDSVTERIRNLKALLDEGLITEKEYEQAKAKILEE